MTNFVRPEKSTPFVDGPSQGGGGEMSDLGRNRIEREIEHGTLSVEESNHFASSGVHSGYCAISCNRICVAWMSATATFTAVDATLELLQALQVLRTVA